jgi:hypothetical protein
VDGIITVIIVVMRRSLLFGGPTILLSVEVAACYKKRCGGGCHVFTTIEWGFKLDI